MMYALQKITSDEKRTTTVPPPKYVDYTVSVYVKYQTAWRLIC